jgi:hypothetical protein
LAARFIFLEKHFSLYMEEFTEFHDLSNDFSYLFDLFLEGRLEILHSILAARVGLTNQAINILRRSFECAIWVAFLSTSSYFDDGKIKVNPFLELAGIWPNLTGNSVTRKDVNGFMTAISKDNQVSKREACRLLLTNFTKYYLKYVCKPSCDKHFNDEKSIAVHSPPALRRGIHRLYKPTGLRANKCYDATCNASGEKLITDKPLPWTLMIRILHRKFGGS